MKELISTMGKFQDLFLTIKSWCEQNQIKQPSIMSYTLKRIEKLYDKYLQKFCSRENGFPENEKSTKPVWEQNQLVLFQWTVIAFSLCKRIYVRDFKRSQIQILSSIYLDKQIYVIQYEIKCILVKGKQIRKTWEIEQERFLSKIIKKIPEKNKWNQIARQLYKVSQGRYFRQGKHCRERWYSCVQNGKSNKDCSVDQDIKLLQQFKGAKNKQFSLSNNFMPSQSRQFLKKRLEVLLQSVKAQFQHQISDQKAISLLLEEHYKKMSIGKNKLSIKRQRTQIQENQDSSLKVSIGEKIEQKEIDRNQVDNIQQCKNNKLSINERVDQKRNAETEGYECNEFLRQNVEQNFMFFAYPTQSMNNICSGQCMPLQFYSQTPQLILSNPGQYVDWCNFSNPNQFREYYFYS